MTVKTKKYQLDNKTYISIALKNVMLEFWWVWIIPVVIMLIPIFVEGAFGWCLGISITLIVLYVLFWLIQFAGVTQLEQNKILFEKLAYEIDSRHIMIKLDSKRGMPVTWDTVKKVKKGNDYFLFFLSKVQFIYLPNKVFRTDNDVKFVETIIKRKKLL
ncbi:MAG: hypothetical protein CMO01_10745 [Thalassobius sp.]|nr:hypothetical protein [Thalassovita sp.]|tara:strand:+ start:1342 stop:1818 length:477 start_codon:yes stop_codon:yes gene_type:complete